jgi:hypothetical protein
MMYLQDPVYIFHRLRLPLVRLVTGGCDVKRMQSLTRPEIHS